VAASRPFAPALLEPTLTFAIMATATAALRSGAWFRHLLEEA
jgi:hypothetical protein